MTNMVYLFKGGNMMKREITIFDIANTFLTYDCMTHKKIQKLCYYAQAWHLALFKERLFNNKFEAWVHGPVCPELYRKLKDNRWIKIDKIDSLPDNIDSETLEFLDDVYYTYGGYDGDDLEYLTHQESPWLNSRKGLEEWEPSHELISEELMEEYYWNVYKQSQGD